MSCGQKKLRPDDAECRLNSGAVVRCHACTPANRAARWGRRRGFTRTAHVPVWAALFANVLAFAGLPTVIPIPTSLGQLLTQGALVAAPSCCSLVNPGGVIRPNLFLVLLTMLAWSP